MHTAAIHFQYGTASYLIIVHLKCTSFNYILYAEEHYFLFLASSVPAARQRQGNEEPLPHGYAHITTCVSLQVTWKEKSYFDIQVEDHQSNFSNFRSC